MRPRIATVAVGSTVVAALLAGGCVGDFGLKLDRWQPARTPPMYLEIAPKVGGGRLVCYFTQGSVSPPVARNRVISPGFHLRFRAELDVRRFDARRAFWDADAHVFDATPQSVTFILAAPIWAFELPCVIAPLLWLRSRRRSKDRSGFAVRTAPPSTDS